MLFASENKTEFHLNKSLFVCVCHFHLSVLVIKSNFMDHSGHLYILNRIKMLLDCSCLVLLPLPERARL